MKAVLMTATGTPEVLRLEEIPEPALATPTQIKVKLHAAGVNPIDTKVRTRGLFYPDALPAILGCDGAGVVVDKGSKAHRFHLGDRVYFCNGGLGGDPGNYAEYAVLDQRWAALIPENLDYASAAAAPLVLITAWGALYDRARIKPNHTVLIHGGAGGVGHVALQLAKNHGARVIVTVGNEEKAAFAQALGADETINYTATDFVGAVNDLTQGRGADVVFDTVGPAVFHASIGCTAHFGDIVTLLDIGDATLGEARMRNLRVGFELMLTPMLRNLQAARDRQVEILCHCGKWIEQGRLRIHVAQVFPLAEAGNTHRLLEEGHTTGKLVLNTI